METNVDCEVVWPSQQPESVLSAVLVELRDSRDQDMWKGHAHAISSIPFSWISLAGFRDLVPNLLASTNAQRPSQRLTVRG
jgi:hypothetical protein